MPFNSQFSYCPLIWMCRNRKNSQPAITCLKLTIKTLEQVVNIFKVNNKDIILLLTLNIFHTLFYTRKGQFCFYSHEEYSISGYWNVSCQQKDIATHHEWYFQTKGQQR